MPRKIFLDGNTNERPSPMFALFLCMIPIATVFYMKRRQRARYVPVAVPSSRTTEPAGRADSGNVANADNSDTSAQEKAIAEKEAEKWEKKMKTEKEKVDAERKRRSKAETAQALLQKQLGEANDKLLRTRYDLDLAQHPEDPALDDPTPDEVYDRVKPIPSSRNRPPPDKPAARPSGDGKYREPVLKKQKSAGFIDKDGDMKAPVTANLTYRKSKDGVAGHPGISVHDGATFTPANLRNGWDPTPARKAETSVLLSSDRHPDLGPDMLRRKTEELRPFLKEKHGILQKATNIALAESDSALYAEAMNEGRHDDYGVYPAFAAAPIDLLVSLFDDDDIKSVMVGMATMKVKIKRHIEDKKDPDKFIARYCMEGTPDKAKFMIAWYLDSFRLVSTGMRMNVIRGEPLFLEMSLGVKFLLLEWLEILGVLCARQRLLSPRGFDLAGLCLRLHCMQLSAADKTWKLSLTLFLPAGPDRTNKDGKPLEDWSHRFNLSAGAWREVWTALITATSAYGTKDDGHGAFKFRELVFCPGFTFEGIKQGGGFPTAPTNNGGSVPSRYDPILNAYTPPKIPSWAGLSNCTDRIIGLFRPTSVMFLRRRQFAWATPSINETSHDFEDGTVAVCLGMVDVSKWLKREVSAYPGEIDDDNLQVRLQNDDIAMINFNNTIPMTMKGDEPVGFPDLTCHPKLQTINMAYVPITRLTNGKQSLQAHMPGTAVLVLSDKLRLKTLLQDRGQPPLPNKLVKLVVDIKAELVQQLAAELWEQFVELGRKEHGADWKGTNDQVNADPKAVANKEVLRQILYQNEDYSTAPISSKMPQIQW